MFDFSAHHNKDDLSVVQVLSVLNKLSAASGGVTKVALSRAILLSNHGFTSFIATLEYDPVLVASISALRSDGRLGDSVQVLNFFVYYSYLSLLADVDGVSLADTFVSPASASVSKRSRFIGVTGMRFNEFMNARGVVFAQEIFDESGGTILFQISIPGCKPQLFKTREDACSAWLEEVCKFGVKNVLIADASTKSEVVSSVSSENSHKILTLHGNHFDRPYSFGSVVKPTPTLILDNLKVCDALVVLTNAQRADIEAQFTVSDKVEVIPNSFSGPAALIGKVRDPKLFVVVSRLEPIKNIAMVVRAFRRAVDSDVSLKLEIWGHGAQEQSLRALISSLKLENNVSLMGYTTTVAEVFSRARASLMSSLSEGFGLSILESMSVGTPVIALAANYGPREIIESGEDGFLIDDENSFAEKILLIAGSDGIFGRLSAGALSKASKFTPKVVGDKWFNLIGRLLSDRNREVLAPSIAVVNTHSTTFGNLFFDAQSIESNELSRYRRVEILNIDRTRAFKGVVATIEPGVYRIANMKYEQEHSRYCLWILQGKRPFDGVVPKGAIRFRLLA